MIGSYESRTNQVYQVPTLLKFSHRFGKKCLRVSNNHLHLNNKRVALLFLIGNMFVSPDTNVDEIFGPVVRSTVTPSICFGKAVSEFGHS